jgi:hypothetical protein
MDEGTRIEETKKDEMRVDELSRDVDKATLAFVRYITKAPHRTTKRGMRVSLNPKTLESRIRKLLTARALYFAGSVKQTKCILRMMQGKEDAFNKGVRPAELVYAMLDMQLEDYDTRLTDTLVNRILVSHIFGTSYDLGKLREESKPLAELMRQLRKRAKARLGMPKGRPSTADVNRLMWSRWVERGIL